MDEKPKRAPKVRNPPQAPPPWRVLPARETGDKNPTEIFTAVGMGLTQWERLEQVVVDIFGEMLDAREGAARAVLGSVDGSKARNLLVLAAAKQVLRRSPLLTELTRLLADLGELNARRTELAHGVVSSITHSETDAGGITTTTDFGYYLMPASYAVKKRNREDFDPTKKIRFHGSFAYTAEQIKTYVKTFADYYAKALDLMWRIKADLDERSPPRWRYELAARLGIAPPQTKD